MNRTNELLEQMINSAKAKNVPVVLVHGSEEGCYCVISDYESTYEDLIRHVINHHGIRDTFFVSNSALLYDLNSILCCL